MHRLLGGCKEPSLASGGSSLSLVVRCEECGELIAVRIDKDRELQAEYDEATGGARPTQYLLRKEIVGADCQNLISFTIRLDAELRVVERGIEGGEFIEPEQE